MKYRLKTDHTKTLDAVHREGMTPPWLSVGWQDSQFHSFAFDVPAAFLEVSGWEPVPEKEPTIEEELDSYVSNDDSPTRRLMIRAAAEIRRLKEDHVAAADRATRAMLERQVRDAVAQRDAAMNDSAELWKKYKNEVDCNAKLRYALVEKITEGK